MTIIADNDRQTAENKLSVFEQILIGGIPTVIDGLRPPMTSTGISASLPEQAPPTDNPPATRNTAPQGLNGGMVSMETLIVGGVIIAALFLLSRD